MALATLKRLKPFIAPRRPIFIDPDTHKKIIGKTRAELVSKIVNYRAQNDLEPIENLDLVLQNFWSTLPENKGFVEEVTLERGFLTYLKGGITLVKTMLYREITSKEEADTRAKVCLQCPNNTFPEDKGAFASWADEIAEHAIGDKKSTYHEELGNCKICTCNLRAKVFYGGKIELSKEEKEEMFITAPFCWQLGTTFKEKGDL